MPPYIFLLTALLCATCIAQTIPYQSHSFNDVDYLLQQLAKGVDAFKIDVNAVSKDSCTTYSTWGQNPGTCEPGLGLHQICCLALRGDTSSGPILNDYFNTTDELVNTLNNPKYDYIWNKDSRIARYNRTIYIAINIQYTNITGQITKNWLITMITAIQYRNLDIQLILGSGSVIDYYGALCQNNSILCDSGALLIVNYPFILQGSTEVLSDPSIYANTSNFNIPFPTLPLFCSGGFPSYGDNLPYFFYEVAHETDVQWITNTYLSASCNKPPSHPDFTNVRLTSNIDPEMLQSYLPSNNPLSDITAGQNPLIELLSENQTVLFSYFDASQNATIVQVRSLQDSQNLSLVSQAQLPGGPFTKMSYDSGYLLLANQNTVQIFSVQNSTNLTLQCQFNITSTVIDSDLVIYNGDVYLVQVTNPGQCPSQSLSFTVTNLNSNAVVLSQCTSQINAFSTSEILSASLAVSLDGSQNLQGVLFVSANYTNFNQKKKALYAFSFTTGLSEMNLMSAMTINVPTSYIDFGVDPSVKIVSNNGSLYVLEAHSDGICQCGDTFNNGNSFKCGISNTLNSHRALQQNMKYMLNYNWGRIEDFTQRIEDGQFVNGCDSQIMHAKFYNGEKPSGIVYRDASSGVLQALFVNQYVDYSELPMMTKIICGATVNYEGSGVSPGAFNTNAFNVLDFYLFEYL